MDGRGQTIFVAGHRGMVGSAIVRRLRELGHERILTADRQSLDLLDQAAVRRFFADNRIDQSTSLPPRSAASTPTTPIPPNSFTRTC